MTATERAAPSAATGRGDRGGSRTSAVPDLLGNPWFLRAAALALILAAWELILGGGRVDPSLSAPPSKVLRSIPDVVTSELFVSSLLTTIRLFALGFAISAVLGILLGFLLARVSMLDAALSPIVNGLYASPLPALVPIITAILGYFLVAKLLIVVLLGVFPILINAYQGAKDTDPTLIEVGRSLRVSESRMWRDVIFPYSLPFLIVGLRLGAARALIGTVVAELYTSPGGLGFLILQYGFRFDMDSMLVVVLTLTLMGVVLSGVIRLMDRRVANWRVRA